MNNFIKRLIDRLRTSNSTAIPGDYNGSNSGDAIAPAFDFTITDNNAGTNNAAPGFEGFDDGDFGGAGAGEGWADNGASDGCDAGGDGGGGDGGGGSD